MLLLFVALWLKTHHRFDPDSNKQFENIFGTFFNSLLVCGMLKTMHVIIYVNKHLQIINKLH